ncbi:MAG: AAA family ATPase, partial [Alphaproteobacteria bacterium]
TVMFCDLVGSTELSRKLDPEDLRELMARYQDAVAAQVARYEGHIAKYLGDGVLAYFGWPVAFEDQAERAVRAGLDAVAAVAGLKCKDGKALSARVGIATGQVVVGDLVGVLAEDAQAVTGETPNLAARLQGVAAPGQLIIGLNTHRLLGTAFDLEALEPQSLKGFDEAVPAWRVHGESAAEDRFEAAHGANIGRLVGRDHELGLVMERWNRVVEGHGQVVLLTAEAGLGKSRMVRAVRDEIAGQDHFRLSYQCSPLHTNTAFYPIAHQLARAAGFGEGDTSTQRLDKLERLLRQAKGDIADEAPIFATLLALPFKERYGELDMEPQQLRARTIEALVDQVLSLGRQKPVLLILEDAHWLDPTTESLIGELIVAIADSPVLILIMQRPEYRTPWLGHTHLTTVVLNRLDQSQAAEIVRTVAGDAFSESLLESIVDRSGGVPLFLEELTKSVVESETAGLAPENIDVPDTLQASLMARLDRLGEAKDIAQVGAAIGREFGYGLVAEVAGKPVEEVDAALAAVVSSELVFQHGSPPEARYTFKHALIQDAAYDSLLLSRRRDLHQRVVAAMEDPRHGQVDDHIEALAYHAQRGEIWDKALNYCRLAGKRANDRSANHEALRFMESGLTAAKHLGDDPQAIGQVIDIYMNLRPSLGSFGQYERLLTALSEANRLALSIGDNATANAANIVKTHVLYQSGQVKQGLQIGEDALAFARTSDDRRTLVAATANLAMGYCFHGDFRLAVDTALESIDDLKTVYRHENLGTTGTSSVNWLGNLTGMYSNLGEFDEARACCEEARRIADETGKPFDAGQAGQWYSHYLLMIGQPEDAARTRVATIKLIEENDLSFLSAWMNSWLGEAYTLMDDLAGAETVLLSAADTAERSGLQLSRCWSLARLALVYLEMGATDTGTDYAERALALSRESGSHWFEQISLRHLARALMLSGSDLEGEDQLRAAVQMAERMEAKPELAHCRRDLGKYYSRIGRPSDAARELDAAVQLYRSLGMTFWLPETVSMLDKVCAAQS